jgi:adenylate kinase family enzyme
MKGNNEFVISNFIQKLRDDDESRVVIEDFPMKLEYFNLFVKNGKAFRKIFYLNCEENNCVLRMKDIGKENKNYAGCAKLKEENGIFDSKKDLIEVFKKKANLIEINTNNELNLTYDEIVKAIKPEIYIFESDKDSQVVKKDLIDHFEKKLKFEVIDVLFW